MKSMNQMHSRYPAAVARVMGGEGTGISGLVKFFQLQNGVLVAAEVSGLPENGVFGFHIHEGPDCQGAGFPNTGGHYNPTGALHPYHAVDLLPLFSSAKGTAYMTVLTDRFRVKEIIGRTVIIHSGPDDFHTQPSGNSGAKMACGVIRQNR